MDTENNIHIGTSGWHYNHWLGKFYPEEYSSEQMLPFYRRFFSTVEINNTFYQMPEENTIQSWLKTVSDHFSFSVKGSRYITHMKKLNDPKKPVSRFLDKARLFNGCLGPILFQCPPNWQANPGRLNRFLETVPDDCRCAMEFRDKSWFSADIYSRLRDHGAAFCIYDLSGCISPLEVTADFIYLRLHGPDEKYKGSYSNQALEYWADKIRTWREQEKEVYCYFNNDHNGYAPQNALKLKTMLTGNR